MAEDPGQGFWRNRIVVVPWNEEHNKFRNSQSLGDALANKAILRLRTGKRIHQVQVNAC